MYIHSFEFNENTLFPFSGIKKLVKDTMGDFVVSYTILMEAVIVYPMLIPTRFMY